MTGNELKDWREKLEMTQGQLAHALEVDVMTISRWEREVRSIPTYLKLAMETVERNQSNLPKPKDGKAKASKKSKK
jgi:DNA-binding transcriptional regulator YiaG